MSAIAYFGPAALRKAWEEHVEAPIGAPCVHCEERVVAGDVGTINGGGQVLHYECGLRQVIGSVGHQKRLCSCYGGSEEDPPGMTRRQAAAAAARYFHRAALLGAP